MGYSPWGHKESDMSERLHFLSSSRYEGASLMPQMVKNLPAMQKTWVQFLGQEDPLEKEMVFHSVFLSGKSHG